MKRTAICEVDGERKLSKPRVNLSSFSPESYLEQNPFDVFENGPNPLGFIRGKFFMVWRPTASTQKFLAVVEVAPEPCLKYTDSRTVRFQVEFSGYCRKFFNILEDSIDVATHFTLSLKGAHLEKRSSSAGLPMTIVFSDGVKIKCTHSRKEIVIDTWMMEQSEEEQDVNWFSTPLPTSKQRSLISRPPSGIGEEDPMPLQVGLQSSEVNVPHSISDNEIRTPTGALVPEPPTSSFTSMAPKQSLTTKQKRKQKRAAKASLGVSETAATISALDHLKNNPHAEISPVITLPTKLTTLSNSNLEIPNNHSPYTLLKDIPLTRYRQYDVVGVVISKSIPKQIDSSKDWHCSFRIVDPSNAKLESFSSSRGIQVNCFKKFKYWLPCPEVGDIVILRGVKVSEFKGNLTLAGYHDILRWVVFSPTKRKSHHGDEIGASGPEISTAEGAESRSLHFFDPGEPDLRHCQELSDWWSKLQNDQLQNAQENVVTNICQVPFNDVRQHRLIREAHPDAPLSGYFDCTIEVLAGFPNPQDNIYSLHVTDYTSNDNLHPVQANWCPASMAKLVLKIEMWDDAATLGRTMEKGSYYHIRNARIKRSNGGLLEGKVVEQKITQLEEREAETNLHLKALLERKQAWEKVNDSSALFEHRLIGDVVEDSFLNGTVEILRFEERNGPCLYVTDYTGHPQLSSNYSGTWSLNLQGRILRVLLDNEQHEMAKFLSVPGFYRINKLRLRISKAEASLHGFLGGSERKIQKLALDAGDEHYVDLIRRKSIWQKQENSAPVQGLYYSTINEILEFDQYPNKYRIFATVIEIYPPDLKDAIVLFCSRCKSEIVPSRKACYDCQDFDHDYVQYSYHLALVIEDKEGRQLALSVDDDCHLFNDLKRIDIRDDPEAQIKLRDRLRPFLGTLVDINQPLGMDTAQLTTFHTLVIECWKNSEGIPEFGLARVDAP